MSTFGNYAIYVSHKKYGLGYNKKLLNFEGLIYPKGKYIENPYTKKFDLMPEHKVPKDKKNSVRTKLIECLEYLKSETEFLQVFHHNDSNLVIKINKNQILVKLLNPEIVYEKEIEIDLDLS